MTTKTGNASERIEVSGFCNSAATKLSTTSVELTALQTRWLIAESNASRCPASAIATLTVSIVVIVATGVVAVAGAMVVTPAAV